MRCFTIAVAILISCIQGRSRWLEFDDIGYHSYRKFNLSGGTDVSLRKYNAPTAVVESTLDGLVYYPLSTLFDGSVYFKSSGDQLYWWGYESNNDAKLCKITVTFDEVQNISHIVVAAETPTYGSRYAIDGYENAHSAEAVHITQMVRTNYDVFGQVHAHSVKGQYEALVFIISFSGNARLNEIEIFVSDSPDESTTLIPTTPIPTTPIHTTPITTTPRPTTPGTPIPTTPISTTTSTTTYYEKINPSNNVPNCQCPTLGMNHVQKSAETWLTVAIMFILLFVISMMINILFLWKFKSQQKNARLGGYVNPVPIQGNEMIASNPQSTI